MCVHGQSVRTPVDSPWRVYGHCLVPVRGCVWVARGSHVGRLRGVRGASVKQSAGRPWVTVHTVVHGRPTECPWSAQSVSPVENPVDSPWGARERSLVLPWIALDRPWGVN